ncbi:MAG: hypothetical protein MET45_12835 [Nostoc sp. LLA-1]|nr:hypothetical protein [Cyanocohniella sp. LLY]
MQTALKLLNYDLKRTEMAKNERETENIVRDKLRELGYYSADNLIQVEEQKSNIESIKKLLKSGSKSGKGGSGYLEGRQNGLECLYYKECSSVAICGKRKRAFILNKLYLMIMLPEFYETNLRRELGRAEYLLQSRKCTFVCV